MVDNIKSIVNSIIQDKMKVITDLDNIAEDTQLMTDLGIDSIKMLELIVDLEDSLDIQIDDNELDLSIIGVYGKLIHLVEAKVTK